MKFTGFTSHIFDAVEVVYRTHDSSWKLCEYEQHSKCIL